jgi:hypothetical protein
VAVVLAVGHQRIHHEHHVGSGRRREISVTAEAHPAVDVVAPTDAVGIEEPGNGRGRSYRVRDRDRGQIARAEDDALRRVDVHRRDEQRAPQLSECVAASARGQSEADEALQRGQREESGGEVTLRARQNVGQASAASLDRVLAERPHQPTEARGHSQRIRVEEDTAPHVQGIVEILIVDLVDLAGANAAGQQGGHDGPGAAADVDVEGRLPAGQALLEGGQSADLVHPADHAPTRQG